jgi:hypothetical protein
LDDDRGSTLSSPTLPASGSMRNGRVYERPTSAPHTGGNAGSASHGLLKTPTAQLAVNGGSQHPDKRKAGGHGPTLADEVEHLLPTPDTGMSPNGHGRRGGRSGNGRQSGASLDAVAKMLPTPKATNNENRQSLDRYGPNLGMVLTELNGEPTPQRSTAGSASSDGLPLGQLTIEDALVLDSSNG